MATTLNRATGRLIALVAILLVITTSVTAQTPATDAALAEVRAALRGRDFEAAVRLADRRIGRDTAPADEALYLKAVALGHLGRHDEVLDTLEVLTEVRLDSVWHRKARFLAARSLIETRRFEAAERIYEAEAHRLLAPERKQSLASVLVRFADDLATEPDRDDVGAPPADFNKAYSLYGRVLGMEIGRGLRDDVLFKLATTAYRSSNYGQAVVHLHAYLHEFDPDWTGPVGSPQRMRGQVRENPPPAGRHIVEARSTLARAQLAMGQPHPSRRNFEDLLGLIGRGVLAPDHAGMPADTAWRIVSTYGLPQSVHDPLETAIKAARDFLTEHADHPHAVEAAWLIPSAYQQYGRYDEAIEAYEAFIAGRDYRLPEGDARMTRNDELGGTPVEVEQNWRSQALFEVGRIRFQQRRYESAIEHWQRYVNLWPNGPQWSAAQRQIIDARYMLALDAVAVAREAASRDTARSLLQDFLAENPLDARAPQVLFILGQMRVAEADEIADRGGDPASAGVAWRGAIDEWSKLIRKYPSSEEASVALYRTGILLEEKLGEHEDALDAFRRVTWGSAAGPARQRIAVMTRKHLALRTERKFRTVETALVAVDLRNIEKLTVRQYFLDPEAYFRKTHTTGGVEALDIALIEPDRTWEIEVDDYGRYRPLSQEIEIPFEDGRPGVCIVNVAEDDLEATTLVIRSNLDVAMRTSRRELLVYAQDMTSGQPADDVRVLISDGNRVLSAATTGPDGVWRGRLDELKRLDDVRVFAIADGHIASNAMALSGLAFSSGLSSKGYVYTDRPAYRPGQSVHARGIIRDVRNGAYHAPAGAEYVVNVSDPHGRLIRRETLELSKFGTFDTSFALDAAASVGSYTIAVHPDRRPGQGYTGRFEVQQFQLETVELAFDFERSVYFRGEVVNATVTAKYYWGEPAGDREVHLTLPDGRRIVDRTGDDGTFALEFDTSGMTPGQTLGFTAHLPADAVTATGLVMLPAFAFTATVAPEQPLALAGEPFDVTVSTAAADGESVGRDMTLFVLRRRTPQPDPVLDAVPWVGRPRDDSAPVTVAEHRVTTDPETGHATVNLTLEAGGSYVLRVAGDDRFGRTVVAESGVTVSDDDDETKLRFLAETNTLQVGATANVRLHSRIEGGTALLTWEGEEIIAHRILPIRAGDNPIALDIGHEHFPNFTLSAMVLDDRDLRTASKPFTVERALRVTVRPLRESYAPDASGEIELIVTDQLDRPVEAELSLALVDEALLAIHPDVTPPIAPFFETEARRHTEFRVAATNGFTYVAQTRGVVKAFQEEQQRIDRAINEFDQLAAVREQLAQLSVASDAPAASGAGGRIAFMQGAMEEKEIGGGAVANAPMPANRSARFAARFGKAAGDDAGAAQSARREEWGSGWWSPSIVTDSEGRARVTVPMPGRTTRWRIMARGASVETLVGQAEATVITRRDFFVELKAPNAVVEGDEIEIIARVHNLADYEGSAALTLSIASGSRRFGEFRRTLDIEPDRDIEVVFEPFTVPSSGRLDLTVAVEAGPHRDALAREIPVRAWGLAYAAHGGGAGAGAASLDLELPIGRRYASRWLTVAIGPNLQQAVIDMALHTRPVPMPENGLAGAARRGGIAPPTPVPAGGSIGGDLLAAVSGLVYARQVDASDVDREALAERARTLAAALVVSQHASGGWGWIAGADPDWHVTSVAYWALSEARRAGIEVHADTLAAAQRFLHGAFQSATAVDHDMKAVVLHALSTGDAADFKLANALYRERNGLGPLALAYTALTLANLDRAEIAREVLEVLEAKRHQEKRGNRAVCSWSGGTRRYPWLDGDVDTTAIALLALLEVNPRSPLVPEAVNFLLDRRGCLGFTGGLGRGPAVAGLSRYFSDGAFAARDMKLTVLVNGEPVRSIERRGGARPVVFEVPAEVLKEGTNTVRFEPAGRGHFAYSATLRGFSADLDDPRGWTSRPWVQSRRYFHAPLEYRGVPIGAQSSSPVARLESGQRTRVVVNLKNGSYEGLLTIEESLPAGATLVPGSLRGNHVHHEVRDGAIVMYYPRGLSPSDYTYELVGYAPGTYRVLPTIIRDAVDPSRMRVGAAETLRVLPPGVESDDPYRMNDAERLALGKAHFEDGLYREALDYLWPLFDREHKYAEQDVARMVLWIHTTDDHYDSGRVVQAFEVLSVRHPQLTIPFDRILVVGRAYGDLGEHERAWLVYRATIDSSFLIDSSISAVLQDEGRLLGSVDFQESLWWQYPDTAEVSSSLFALAQLLYEHAPRAHELVDEGRRARPTLPGEADRRETAPPTRAGMLGDTVRLLDRFLTLHPTGPLADDAAFSTANAFLDLQDFDRVIELSEVYRARYADSVFASSFQYMTALGHFWKRSYEPALAAARVVADGDSSDSDFARYILGQIYHAEGRPAEAIEWYERVRTIYPDASEAIEYFREKRLELEEVTIVRPGDVAKIKLEYRNIAAAHLQVYKVDLMKLYLREKNLSNITQVNLAGIEPQLVRTVVLGDGLDYVDKKTDSELELTDEGAYLVICRGDDLFASGLVLITPLRIEVQQDATSGRVRVNLIDEVEQMRPANVHVKAVGSADGSFRSGETDLRGVFVADGIRGEVTAIARDAESRYAFFRGDQWLGAPPDAVPATAGVPVQQLQSVDYQDNLRKQVGEMQRSYGEGWDRLRRSGQEGVQVDKAK